MVPVATTPMEATAWALASTSTFTWAFTGSQANCALTRLNDLSTSTGVIVVLLLTLKSFKEDISNNRDKY